MKNRYRLFAGILLAGAAFAGVPAPAFAAVDDRDARIQKLEETVTALMAEIKDLKAEQAAEKSERQATAAQVEDLKRSASTQVADAQKQRAQETKVTIANGRPTIASADGKFTASIRALVQYDAAYFMQGARAATAPDLSSGTNFRRARLGIDGKLFGDWSYSFLYDLGGTNGSEQSRMSDAYIQYDGLAPFHFRIGSFATPASLEDQTGTGDLLFLERAASADLQRSIAGSDGRQNLISIFANGEDYYGAVSISGGKSHDPAAAFFDEQQALVDRFAYRIYSDADTNIVLSANSTYVFKPADTTASPGSTSNIALSVVPENYVDSQNAKLVNTGNINADNLLQWGVEFGANFRNFYAQAGYFDYRISRRDSALPDPNFNGWYAQGSWVLTGENRRYNSAVASWASPQPAKPFDLATGGWGAWELAGRYSVLDLDFREGNEGFAVVPGSGGIRGGEQKAWTVGLNWYPNNSIRFLFDFQHVDVDRISSTAPFAQIGQDFDILSLRAQLAL